MEKLVQFRDRQELQAADLTNVGAFAQASLDHVVYDGIQEEKSWAVFDVIKSATLELTVKPGRIYSGGAVYVSESDVVFDLLNDVPIVNKKWVAIVGWGQAVDTDTQPRDFLIDAMEGTTEPQAVPMQKLRKANINKVVGNEAAQPVKPTIGSENVVIAWVLVGPADIESIEMVSANRLPNLAEQAARIDALEAWRNLIGPRVDSLTSDIARLAALIALMGRQVAIDTLAYDIARLKEFAELEDNYSDWGADRFLDELESATNNVNYLCRVEEGVRFGHDAANEEAIQLFNPIDPNVTVTNGLILPKFTEVRRFHIKPFYESKSISQYQYATHECVQKTMSKTRIRYGEEKTVCTNAAWWHGNARMVDAAENVFSVNGELWQVTNGLPDSHGGTVHFVRLRRYWIDTYTETYWDKIVTNHTISGQLIGETFLQPQDAWLTSVGLFFTQKGASGNVEVLLTETAHGMPDVTQVLQKVTLNVNNILTSADATTETKVSFPPTLLQAGRRYAIVLITGGNHYVGMAQGTQYAQGSFFYAVDGAYMQGTADRDMMFSMYFAQFAQTRTVVELKAMSLSGGITDIDILAKTALPASCDLTYEVQPEGTGIWKPIAEVASGNTILYNLPPLCKFRAVFTGTTDIQPAIDTTGSRVYYSRPRTTLKHISNNITVATPTQSFKVTAILENYYEVNHNASCTLQLGGSGGEVSPATVTDVELDPPVDARSVNHKRIKRTWSWTATQITAPTTVFRITLDATTTSALDTFHFAERVHLAF